MRRPIADAHALAETLRAAVSRPLDADGHRIIAGASLGIVLSRRAHTIEEVLGEADRAMYRAKTAGKNRVPDGGRQDPVERAHRGLPAGGVSST
jgi:GGDEF domain-containing protein